MDEPIFGRTNPILQFAKRLSSKGITVTLATTSDFTAKLLPASESSPFLSIESITVDFDQSQSSHRRTDLEIRGGGGARAGEADRGEVGGRDSDSSFPWALRIARKIGILAAPFFPQPCAVSLIFFHVHNGVLEVPVAGDEDGRVSAPRLSELVVGDLPTLVR